MDIKRPFILLAGQRTGSTLLIQLLNQHSAIAGGCWGEFVFNLRMVHRGPVRDPFLRLQQQRWLRVLGYLPLVLPQADDPLLVYAVRRALQLGAGLKLTPDLDLARANPGWPALLDGGFAWIHLRRRNKLRQLVSFQAALQTRQWHCLTASEPRRTRVQVDCRRLLAAIGRMEQSDQWHRRRIAGHHVVELEYGQILRDGWPRAMQAVWRLLELAPEPTAATLRRVNDRPLEEAVSNWREARRTVADSPYAWMWDDVDG